MRGLVHGAGVLEDKLLAQKTRDSFDRVFDTKVRGLAALLRATASDPLSWICLFSSVAARAGNAGQADYAMANEVLAKVAWAESRRRPGLVVKSFGWGPWEGGMVTPALKRHFTEHGVALIPLELGARMMLEELSDDRQIEVVLGGAPRRAAIAGDAADADGARFAVHVDASSHPYLADHAIERRAGGAPGAGAGAAARAATAAAPGLAVAARRTTSGCCAAFGSSASNAGAIGSACAAISAARERSKWSSAIPSTRVCVTTLPWSSSSSPRRWRRWAGAAHGSRRRSRLGHWGQPSTAMRCSMGRSFK